METNNKRDGFDLVLERYLGISNKPNEELSLHAEARIAFCADGFMRVYVKETKAWNGEGTPPAWTNCEYQVGGGPWYECSIRYVTTPYHDCPVEVVMFAPHLKGEQTGVVGKGEGELSFRPILTPEQIAAEEREGAIHEMVDHLKRWHTVQDLCGDLYDAGYRKQVKP